MAKYTHSKLVGAGGIKCPCCRKHMSLKQLRTKLSRVERRKIDQSLHQLAIQHGEPDVEEFHNSDLHWFFTLDVEPLFAADMEVDLEEAGV